MIFGSHTYLGSVCVEIDSHLKPLTGEGRPFNFFGNGKLKQTINGSFAVDAQLYDIITASAVIDTQLYGMHSGNITVDGYTITGFYAQSAVLKMASGKVGYV